MNLSLDELYHKTCDLYTRVSTQEQAEEGFSLAEQQRKLAAYAEAMGYRINAVRSDPGISGSTLDRPGIQAVIDDVKAHRCGVVIVWKLDRLSRSQKDMMALLEDVFAANDCAFVSLSENFDTSTPIGKCIVGVLAAFAQMERENIRIRTMMGKKAAYEQGRYIGGPVPIGYRLGEDKIFQPDPDTAPIIQEIFASFLSGASLYRITADMGAKYGLFQKIAQNKENGLKAILKNPVYCGRTYGGKVQAIISEDDWEKAQARLSDNRQIYNRTRKRAALLAGIVWCGRCGARMAATAWTKKRRAYACHSRTKRKPNLVRDPGCKNPVMDCSILEDAVLDQIRNLKLAPQDPEVEASDTAPYEARLKDLDRKRDHLLDLYENEVLTLEDLKPRLEDLKKQRAEVEAVIAGLQKQVKPMDRSEALEMADLIDQADDDQQREIVIALIQKITVDGDDVRIYWNF